MTKKQNTIDLTGVVTPDDFTTPYTVTAEDRARAQQVDEKIKNNTTPNVLTGQELEQSIARGQRQLEYTKREQDEREFYARLNSARATVNSDNIMQDAVAQIPMPDELDQVSLARYESAVQRKQRANKILALANYQNEHNPEMKKQFEDYCAQMADPDNPVINKVSLAAKWTQDTAKQYNDVINKYGGASDEMLLDPNFRKYCTPTALNSLLAARESLERADGKDGWFRKFGRMWEQEKKRRNAAVDFLHTGDKVAYDKANEQLSVEYERSYDGETMKGTVGSLVGMLEPIFENPVKTGASIVGAVVTGLITKNPALAAKVLGYGYSTELALDSYDQFQADMLNTAMQTRREQLLESNPETALMSEEQLAQYDKELDKDTFLSKTRGAATLSAILNVVGAKYMTRGTTEALKPLIEGIQRQAVERPIVKAIQETGKAIAQDTLANTAISGAQQYINTAATMNTIGAENSWAKAEQAGLAGLRAALEPSAVLSTVFSAPRLFTNMRRYTVDNQARAISAQRIQTEERLHQQLQQQGLSPDAQTALFQRTLGTYGEVAFSPRQVMDTIDTLGLTGEQIPEPFRDRQKLEEMAQRGEEITMNKAQFYQDTIFNEEQRKAFGQDYRYTDLSDKTLKDLNNVSDEAQVRHLADEIAKQFEEDDAMTREDLGIASQVEQRLAEQNIGSVQARSANARMVAAFCRAMSKTLKVKPQEVLDTYIYRIVRNDKPDALNLKQDQGVDYDANIKGKTDPLTRLIELNADADMSTIFEELAHNMLLVTDGLVRDGKASPEVAAAMQGLKKWLGDPNLDLSKVDANNIQAHEMFVAAFMQYLILGRADKNGIDALRGFKEMLSSVAKSRNAYGLDAKQSDFKGGNSQRKKANKIGKNFKKNYGKGVNQLNKQFDEFISALFKVERKAQDLKLRAELASIFEGVDPELIKNLSPDDLNAFVKLAQQGEQILKDSLLKEELLNRPMVFKALSQYQMNRARKAAGYNKKNSELTPATLKDKAEMKAYTQLCNYLIQREKQLTKDVENYIQSTSLSAVYDTIRQHKINSNDAIFKSLPKKERDALIAAGLVSDKGTLSAGHIQTAFSQFQTVDPRNMAAKAIAQNFGKPEDGLHFLARSPDEKTVTGYIVDELMKGEREGLKDQFTAPDPDVYILDTRMERNRREWKLLNGEMFNKENLQLCRDTAKRLLARSKWSQVTVASLINKANRAHRQAAEYLKKGDKQGAFKCIRAERVLMEQAKLLSIAKPTLEKRLKAAAELASRSDKQLAKRYDMKIMTMARVVLSQVGIKDWRMSHENIDLNYEGIANNPDLVDFANLIAGRTDAGSVISGFWKDKSFQDVELITRMIDAIERVSRKNGWLKNKGAYDLAVKDAQAEMTASLGKLKDRYDPYDSGANGGGAPRKSKGLKAKVKDGLRDYNYSFMRPENFFQELDGKDTEGGWHKYVYTPIKNAEIQSQKDLAEWHKAIRDATKKYKLKFKANEVIDCPELEFTDDVKAATGLTHMCFGTSKDGLRAGEQLLGIILHMGNRDNLNKLLKGYFGDKVTEEVFIKWFNRMVDEGHITKEMLDFAQAVWDVNEKYFKNVQKAHYETKGYEVKVVDPRVIHTKWGDYRGGVVRAIANEDLIMDSTLRADDFNDLANSVERTMPTIKNGFTIERKAGAVRPLCLDAQRLISETRNMILYSHFQPALTAVNKVLTTEMRAKLERKRPKAYDQLIKPWLITTIQQKTTLGTNEGIAKQAFEFLGYMTRMLGQAIMVGNLNNTLQQISGFASLMVKVPPSQVALSLCRSLGHWKEIKAECAKSEFMQNRLRNVNDGVQNIFQDMIFTSSQYDGNIALKGKLAVKQINTWARQHSYFMQKFFQDYIDRVAYDAAYQHATKLYNKAYQKAINEGKTVQEAEQIASKVGMTEEQAQRYAESVVRTTQSSFDVSDMTSAEKSTPLIKMFTQFGGYFYTMYRLQSSQIHMICARENVSSVHKALSIAWTIGCSMVFPAIIAESVNGVMNGSAFNDDNEDHEYAKAVLFSVPKMYLGAMPFVGKWGQYALDGIQGKNYASSSILSNPTMGAIQNAITAGNKIANGKPLKPNDIKAAIQILAALSGCPMMAWAGREIAFEYGVDAGYYMPESAWDLLRGYLTGTASPQSKTY